MEWLKGSLSDAVKLAAAKSLLVREKRADGGESEKARRTLGYLGANEGKVNDLASRYGRGELSRTGAMSRFHATAGPGIASQVANLPSSISTAAGQGDVTGALNQADVVGLKNLNPITNPLTTGLAGAGAIGGGILGSHMQDNSDIRKLLRGTYTADASKDPLVAAVKGDKAVERQLKPPYAPGETEKLPTTAENLETYRRNQPSKMQGMKSIGSDLQTKARRIAGSYRTGGLAGVGRTLKRTGQSIAGGIAKHVAGPELPAGISRGRIEGVLEAQRAGKGRPMGRSMMMAGALGSIPLMAREWLHPTGYRSGHNPFSKVLDANEPRNKESS